MTTETATAIQVGAAVVQGFAAAITLFLTIRLIGYTRRATASAERQSTEAAAQVAVAREQVKESIEAREVDLRPYLHVLGVGFQRTDGGGGLIGLAPDVRLRNVGRGTALRVRLVLWHPTLVFQPQNGPQVLEAGEPYSGTAGNTVLPAAGEELTTEAHLWIEYRDLLGNWWSTDAPLDLRTKLVERSERPEGYVVDCDEIVVLDQREHLVSLGAPLINHEMRRPDALPASMSVYSGGDLPSFPPPTPADFASIEQPQQLARPWWRFW